MRGAGGDLEGLAVPLVEHGGPVEIAFAGRGRIDGMIADLDQTVGMWADPRAEHARDHLGAKANAEQRDAGGQRLVLEPVELGADARQMIVVGALRPAEYDGGGIG